MSAADRPDVTYADIGGNDVQKQEMREAVELPLTQGELYAQLGIDPPRGVLLYGPPGTGKTMLAKAVAHHTTASFIRVVGSEFVQKYLGEVRARGGRAGVGSRRARARAPTKKRATHPIPSSLSQGPAHGARRVSAGQ